MKIVFAGSIGRFPVGGHAWVDMQYLLGLRDLGHDVAYLEDCGDASYVYDWEREALTSDLDYPAQYLASCLEPIGFGERWSYRAGVESAGMSLAETRQWCSEADLLIVRGSPLVEWRAEYARIPSRVFIDSDPGFTQIAALSGKGTFAETIERCQQLFTVGARVGHADCSVPTLERRWVPMLPPVHLPSWPQSDEHTQSFTSVMQWHSYQDVEYQGLCYGNKNREYPKFFELPRLAGQDILLAMTGRPPQDISALGWRIVEGWRASFTPDDYRDFVRSSKAEFGVAKHGYVSSRGGWFSDRSACYLASGRPVLLQDTGLADLAADQLGIVVFSDLDGALRGVRAINADYEAHARAGRAFAVEHLDGAKILTRLLELSVA